jgi:hypothetical protein
MQMDPQQAKPKQSFLDFSFLDFRIFRVNYQGRERFKDFVLRALSLK